MLVIVAGVIAALVTVHVLHGDGKSNGTIAGTVIGIAGGRTVSASSLAFLGYVLQLLIAIHFDVRLQDSANAASALMTGVKEQLTVLAGRGLMATRASHLQPRRSYLELGICVLAGVVLLQLGQLLIGGGDAEERFVGRLH